MKIDLTRHRKVIVIELLLLLLVLALVGYGISISNSSAQQATKNRSQDIALLASEQIARTFQATSIELDTVNREILLYDGLVDTGPHSRVSRLMRERIRKYPYIRALFVIGADGHIIHDTDTDTPDVSLADRGYFIMHRDDPKLGFTIGKPLVSRSVYVWFISATKRIETTDGSFAGIVVAAIEPRFLEQTYAALKLEDFRSVNLWMSDSTLMMRYPRLEQAIAQQFPDRPEARMFRENQVPGIIFDAPDIDGGSNIIAYSGIPNFPLYLSVVSDPKTELERWISSRWILITTGIIAVLLILLSIYFVRRLQYYYTAEIQAASERERMMEQLSKAGKMEALGELTSGIAHDFNNILGIVLGNLELLYMKLREDPDASKRIKSAISGAQRGARLTERLLRFSRASSPDPIAVDVNKTLEGMHEMLCETLPKTISIEFVLTDQVWLTIIDVGDLEDAILNLVLNARDAMPDGGILRIETRNVDLDSHFVRENPNSRQGEHIMIAIHDTGTGIEPAIAERIFEPFFTSKEKGKGTGLGLAMVYAFVGRSGGFVKVEPGAGGGTVFRLFLPRSENLNEAVAVGTEEVKGLPQGSETILLVDDEPHLLNVAESYLRDLGYQTITASSGDAALEILNSGKTIDLLFTDVVMPGKVDGFRLAAHAMANYPNLKVLLTSGVVPTVDSDQEEDQNLVNSLNRDLLSKPYNRTDLAEKVRQVLDRLT